MNMKPLISIIIPTYNRADTLPRTIESILNQTWQNFEVVVVDDGSSDTTGELLKQYKDERIKVLKHEVNKGVTAAKNTGLNNIRGEWFTVVDSDDELVTDALESVIDIPLNKDQTITKVTCNGIDSTTNELTGRGLDHDQYIDEEVIISRISGDFWGLTKTELLGNDRFIENLSGVEDTLWFKIYAKARIFYLHKAPLIVHTEGIDRVSNKKKDMNAQAKFYGELIKDEFYLGKIEMYNPGYHKKICFSAVVYLACAGKKETARQFAGRLKKLNKRSYYVSLFALTIPSRLLKWLTNQWLDLRN
jgi:glycosyltransferase involved in cell wall biosynthesis